MSNLGRARWIRRARFYFAALDSDSAETFRRILKALPGLRQLDIWVSTSTKDIIGNYIISILAFTELPFQLSSFNTNISHILLAQINNGNFFRNQSHLTRLEHVINSDYDHPALPLPPLLDVRNCPRVVELPALRSVSLRAALLPTIVFGRSIESLSTTLSTKADIDCLLEALEASKTPVRNLRVQIEVDYNGNSFGLADDGLLKCLLDQLVSRRSISRISTLILVPHTDYSSRYLHNCDLHPFRVAGLCEALAALSARGGLERLWWVGKKSIDVPDWAYNPGLYASPTASSTLGLIGLGGFWNHGAGEPAVVIGRGKNPSWTSPTNPNVNEVQWSILKGDDLAEKSGTFRAKF